MYVTNHVGINNPFVTTSPFTVSMSTLVNTPAYYASQYPFYKFTANAKVCQSGTLALGTTSSYFTTNRFR